MESKIKNHAQNGIFAKTRILADLGGTRRAVITLKTSSSTGGDLGWQPVRAGQARLF